jgi:ABC-type sugar transport system permease subunit
MNIIKSIVIGVVVVIIYFMLISLLLAINDYNGEKTYGTLTFVASLLISVFFGTIAWRKDYEERVLNEILPDNKK